MAKKPARKTSPRRGALRAWLELLRLPNLFTVPGDILVGWSLGGLRGGVPLLPILASLALYASGLLFNDFFDAAIDARERPKRPIPSGRVDRRRVGAVALALGLLGVALAGSGWMLAAGLFGLILFYDLAAKHLPGVGVLTMGACRGGNLLLGFAATWPQAGRTWPPLVLLAAGFFMGYIVLVSVVAKHEADPKARIAKPLHWAPLAFTLALMPLFWWLGRGNLWAPLLASLPLLGLLAVRRPIPALVGGLIRHLVLLQFAWCTLGAGSLRAVAFTLLGCWFLAVCTGRRIAGS